MTSELENVITKLNEKGVLFTYGKNGTMFVVVLVTPTEYNITQIPLTPENLHSIGAFTDEDLCLHALREYSEDLL